MTTTQTIASWTIVRDHTSNKPFALVGMGAMEVLVVIPLFDRRDINMDGTVSWFERITSSWAGDLASKSRDVELLMTVAVETADQDLYVLANKKLLSAGFSAGMQQFETLYLKNYVGDAIGIALDGTALKVISKYFVKMGFEMAFYRFLSEAKKAQR